MLKTVLGAALTLSVGVASAATLYSNAFEAGQTLSGAGSVVPTFFNKYWSTDAASSFTFNVDAGSVSNNTQLSVLFGAIDSWDNGQIGAGPDAFVIQVDNAQVFSAVFDNYQNQGPTTGPGITNLSYGSNLAGSAYNDAVYTLSVNLGSLGAGAHTITFAPSGPGWQGGSDESVALDNIRVTGDVSAVPEASSVALAAVGGLLVAGIARRRRAA